MMTNRRNNIPDYLKEPFVPEYQRLNREPEQFVDPRFAANAPIRRGSLDGLAARPDTSVPNFRTTQKRGLNAPVPRQPQGELMKADSQYHQHAPPPIQKPQPMPVHVGNHTDPMWINEQVTGAPPPSRTKVIDGGEYIDEYGRITAPVDVSSLQGQDPFKQGLEGTDESAWIRAYNEVHNESNKQENPREGQSLNITLAPGEIAVVFNNTVIEIAKDEQRVRDVVENIIMKYDVNLDEIAVYKRQPIDFGVMLK